MFQRTLFLSLLVLPFLSISQSSKFDLRINALAERPYNEEALDFVFGPEIGGKYAFSNKFSAGIHFNYSSFSGVFDTHSSLGGGLDVQLILFNGELLKPYLNLGTNYFNVKASQTTTFWDGVQEETIVLNID